MENLEIFKKESKTWKPNNCPCRLCNVLSKVCFLIVMSSLKSGSKKLAKVVAYPEANYAFNAYAFTAYESFYEQNSNF